MHEIGLMPSDSYLKHLSQTECETKLLRVTILLPLSIMVYYAIPTVFLIHSVTWDHSLIPLLNYAIAVD